MRKKMEMNDLIALVGDLSTKDKKALVNKIMGMMRSNPNRGESKSLSCNDMVHEHLEKERPDCPWCHAQAKLGCVTKRGTTNGVQRYYCKSCGRYFYATSNTAFARTRKDSDVWMKFIELTISGASLKKCAQECKLAYQTAFTWRHKVLNAFRVHQDNTMLSGKVELDEMFLPISYKGNHVQGDFSNRKLNKDRSNSGLPRRSYQRGTDNRSSSSKEKACVFCMVKNGNEGFYAAVPGIGFMNAAMLDKTVGTHVDKEKSMVLADRYTITANYLRDNNYDHMILAASTSDNPHEHRPEIRDGNHLQHINAMHMHLRKFLSKYCGVSTKYLENYISLYVWLKNVTACKQKKHTQKVSVARAATSDCYISRRGIKAFPSIPKCA